MTCFCSEKDIVKNVKDFSENFFIKYIYSNNSPSMKKVFIVFFTSFCLWVVFTLFTAVYINGNLSKSFNISSISNTHEKLELTDFWTVYDIIETQYFSTGSIQKEKLVEGAIKGMVESLGDQHSEFMNPQVHEKFEETLSWDFEWVWAVVEKTPIWVKVERILKGSPAKKYDVRAKDIITEVDGISLEWMDLYDAVEKIKGPAGSQVVLSILRPGEEAVLKINVIREKIHIPSVEEKYFEAENIGYIALNMFGDTTAIEFHEALKNISASWVDGLIIDVRDNGGGYLQSAQQILSEFIPEGEVVVKTRYKDTFFDQSYFSQNIGPLFDKKIVVLMNGNSASASEITAGALREYDKAILVGEKTYGKGSVQQPFDLTNGSLLKLTVAKWFTPKGKNIDEDGISPDIEVFFLEEDYETLYDRQLEEAKKILKIFIEKQSLALSVETYLKSIPKTASGTVVK